MKRFWLLTVIVGLLGLVSLLQAATLSANQEQAKGFKGAVTPVGELAATGVVLDLATVIQAALQQHDAMINADLHYQTKKEALAVMEAVKRPNLGAALKMRLLDPDSGSVFQPSQAVDASLSFRQLLYGDAVSDQLQQQQTQVRVAEAQLAQAELETVLAAGQHYLAILRAKSQIKLRQHHQALVAKNWEIATMKAQLGVTGAADVYRWQSEQSVATSALLQAVYDLQAAKMSLNDFLQQPLTRPFQVRDPGLSLNLLGHFQAEKLVAILADSQARAALVARLLTRAAQQRPEIKELEMSITALKATLSHLKRKPYLPTVQLGAGMNQGVYRGGEGSAMASRDLSWNVGLDFSWDLYEGGGLKHQLAKTRVELMALKQKLRRLQRQIEQAVRQGVLAAHLRASQWALSQQGANAAEQSHTLSTTGYEQGNQGILQLLDSRNAALRARQDAVQSLFNYWLSLLTLARAAGGGTL